MPTFELSGPDGGTYQIDAPDEGAALNAFHSLHGSSEGSSLSGVAKSLGVGLAQGAIGLAGIPGDLDNLLAKGDHYRIDSSGFHYGPAPTGETSLPTSESLQKNVEGLTGPFYKPQGTAENIASKIGQFAPAVIGGPETLATKLATRVAAPAVASEVGKEVAGPYGELAGALGAGAVAGAAAQKFKAMAAARTAAKAAPSAEDLLKTAGDQFNQARDMNMIVKPDFATNAANDMRQAIKGFDPEAHKPVFAAADRLENLGASGPGLPPVAVPMNDVENIRKQLVSLKTSPDNSVREAARKAISSLQDSQKAITAADVLSGDAPAYTKLTGDAIGNWAAGKRSNTVMGKAALGELNAATAGAGANEDNALRQAFKQLARPVNNDITPKWQRLGFNKAEGAAIEKAATGTTLGNAARYLGKAAPTGIVSAAMSGGAGHLAGGPIGAVALPAAGYIAKKIGDLSTKRAVAAVDSLVRSRSPLAAQVAAQLNPQIVQQLPAKSQRILQSLATQPTPTAQPAPSVTPQASILRPTPATASIPAQAPPIFAPSKMVPPSLPISPSASLTAAGDGQPSRPSRIGLGENIRLGKYQDWTDGRIVKVGFVDGLKVEGVVPAVYRGDAPAFILTKGENVYRVTPHRGMEKLPGSEGKQALKDARESNGK
jgi:hypothetical protein